MGSQQGPRPALGATFYPGGVDDFYMPGVISPSPQRITPEVPGKIQDNLAHLELDDAPGDGLSGLQSPSPASGKQGIMTPSFPSKKSSFSNLNVTDGSSQHQIYHTQPHNQSQGHGAHNVDANEQPTFSPFPPLRNRPANVPPSVEEKEGILESARTPVLSSDDPEMQLSWAQDTLVYVEIAAQNEVRISENQAARPRTPHTEHQLRVDAINIVSFLADQHHPKAEFMKGMWLEFGKFNYRVDKKEAFRCYQRAAQKGYARAEYRIGMQFESYNDPEKAIKHYTLGLQAGDSASYYRLGMMTLLGQHGQPLNYERGVKLISYSAQTADENAPQGAYVFGMLQAHELAQINLPEECLPLNITGARFNIEKAAYLGFAKAQSKMGLAYELCQLGCEFDPALSLHYSALAAKQGEPEAEMGISKWFLCGFEGMFEKNEELAFTYAQRAAQSGLATAEFAMGYFCEIGIYVPMNLKESRSWYEKAADHGNKDATARINDISRSNTLSKKDHQNIAVAKIQSQYGSHRGKRPERFKNPPTAMPTIADNPIDMPEPNLPRPKPGSNPSYAYRSADNPAPRPASAAQYPMENGRGRPPQRPANGSSYANPSVPNNPDARPTSAAAAEVSFGDNNYRGSAYPTFQPAQSSIAVENIGAGRGRVGPAYGGSGVQRPPQGYQQANSGYTSPRLPGSPALKSSRPPSGQPPAIDIGYSAPPDPSGADRKRRQQRSDNANMPPPRHPSYDVSAGRPQDRLSGLPHSQTMPAFNRPDSAQVKPNPSGRQGVSRQDMPPRVDSAAPLPNIPPKAPNLDRPAATPPPSGPVSKPPGKGPKTFQEMGVPATKQEGDCVIM
ncbi:hypothetical protein HO173_000950 [Letharia columbiana]|uniref:Chitin synthase activator n=1 Tax=Letharia columbiana TaxID=112416 RepID=A0A8H6G692_9LECA|nr:uncharacterized protein HO173_000950 [Letharia columbiana]KAF6241156.1 hypothetical protein HO173_000950 [Letharia columbiana]